MRFSASTRLAILASVMTAGVGAALPAYAATTDQIVFTSTRDNNQEIYISKLDGSDVVRLTNNDAPDYQPALSADGTKIVFVSERDGNPELYIMNSDGSEPTRLTFNNVPDLYPSLNADATKIYFASNRSDSQKTTDSEIYSMSVFGGGATQITDNNSDETRPVINAAGTKLAFETNRAGDSDIVVSNADGSAQSTVVGSGYYDTHPSFSPDGTSLVYARSNGTDTSGQILVRSLSTLRDTLITKTTGNVQPVFSPDGTQVIYANLVSGRYSLFSVASTGGTATRITPSYFSSYDPSVAVASTAELAPTIVSCTPDDALTFAGEPQSFTLDVRDGNGAKDLNVIYMIVGNTPEFRGNTVCAYDAVNNLVYLRDAANKTWLGGYAPGTNAVVSNTKVTLNFKNVQVQRTVQDIFVRFSLTPHGIAGKYPNVKAYPIWAYATDLANATAKTSTRDIVAPVTPPAVIGTRGIDWEQVGQWTIQPTDFYNASADMKAPVSAQSAANTLTLQVAHTATTKPTEIDFLINDRYTNVGGIAGAIDLVAKKIYVADNSGRNFGNGVAIGKPNTRLTNSQVSILASDVVVSQTSTSTIVTIKLTPSASFTGVKNVYMVSTSDSETAGPDTMSSWKITVPTSSATAGKTTRSTSASGS